MRVSYVLAGLVAMSVSVFVVFKLLGEAPPKLDPNPIKVEKVSTGGLPIAPQGPYPKVVVDTEFDFGRMEVGEKRSHAFTFRNEGEAPLIIKNNGTTCQCTVGEMELNETREIAPGQSHSVKLTWKPEVQAEKFNKGADFATNDPENTTIRLRILGMVAPRLVAHPEKEWFLSNVTDDKPNVFTGTLMSPVADQFKVVSVESTSDLLSFEVVPLEKMKLDVHNGLSGYDVRVTVKPEMPLGAFRYPLTIKTDLAGRTEDGSVNKPMEVEVLVSGVHRGPIQPFAGREWIDEKMAISLGKFEAAEGKKVRLNLFVKSPPEGGLKLTAAPVCTPAQLKVDLEREERPNGKDRYFLNVEYPAGSPRAVYRDEEPGKIRLQTNHPHGQNVEFQVFFSAY